jgi:hypothetical protein
MRLLTLTASTVVGLTLSSTPAAACDHADGPKAADNPAADLAFLYAWPAARGATLNVALGIHPNADDKATFADDLAYVVHLSPRRPVQDSSSENGLDVICTFDPLQNVTCWAGSEFLTGDARSTSGIRSNGGRLRVFTGLRADPSVWNKGGYLATVKSIHDGIFGGQLSISFDGAGCPQLPPGIGTLVLVGLNLGPTGDLAANDFDQQNVLAIAMELDRSLVGTDGDVIGVWASTHALAVEGSRP